MTSCFERPNWPDELASLERPEVLDALARLLGVSDFLWEDFLRMQYANLFPVVRDVDALDDGQDRAQLQAELEDDPARGHAGTAGAHATPPGIAHSMPLKTARCSASICAISWAHA